MAAKNKNKSGGSNKVVFLFIYISDTNVATETILTEITKRNLLITAMKIKNEDMRCWLQNNEHGIVVTEIPCFLIKLPGANATVYPISQSERVFNAVAKLQQQHKGSSSSSKS